MAYSYVQYTGNGSTTNYPFSFPYLDQSHVKVRVNGVVTSFTFLNDSTVNISPAPVSGAIIDIRRETPKTIPPVDFTDGSVLLETDLDELAKFSLYTAQESSDGVADSMTKDSTGVWQGQGRRIKDLADPVNTTDAVNRRYFESVYTPQLDAKVAASSASATAAASSATDAANSASLSTQQATISTNKASEALASERAAQDSEDAALASKLAAASSASTASTKASEASASATASQNSANSSASSASSAASSANSANSSANVATTKASEASASALSAQTSANQSANSANASANSASAAAVSADAAEADRVAAELARDRAEGAADSATTNTIIPTQNIAGNGTTTYTINRSVSYAGAILVTVAGVNQKPLDAYNVLSGNQLVFSEVVPVDVPISVRWLDKESQAGAASAQEWATKTDGYVSGSTEYSAKKHALDTSATYALAVADTTAIKNQAVADTTAIKNQAVIDTTAIKNSAVAETTAIKNQAVADTTAIKDAAVADVTALKNTTDTLKQAAEASATASANSATASANSATASQTSRVASEAARDLSQQYRNEAQAFAAAAGGASNSTPVTFTGNGTQVDFTLTTAAQNTQSIIVSVNGVLQDMFDAYSLANAGSTLRFSEAPASGARIVVRYI